MTRRRGVVLGILVAAAFVLVPVGVLAADNDPEPAQPVVLYVGSNDQMKTRNLLSPIAQDDPHTTAVLARVYDTAVQRNATTGAIVPRLAVGEDANGNGALDPGEIGRFDVPPGSSVTVFYDFTNARFHDGAPVTVMDVLFSYHILALHPQMNGPLRVLMDRGGSSGSNFSLNRWLWVVPVADGDTNPLTAALQFTPQFRYDPFPFATLGIPILPRHLWEGVGAGRHSAFGCPDPDWGRTIYPEGDPRVGIGIPVSETTYRPFNLPCALAWQMFDADVVGSGHFKFASWDTFGSFARIDVNPDYAFGTPKIAGVVFRTYRTTQLGVLALQQGDIDLLLYNLPPEFIPDLQNDPRVRIASAPGLYPFKMVFNTRRQPFGYTTFPPPDQSADNGLPFRRAMQHLADKGTIVRILLQDHGSIGEGMIAPSNDGWHNTSLPSASYDPTLAATILDNAGWTDTDADGWREFPRLGDSRFEILTPTADYDPMMASAGAMIAAAARQVGVNVNSRPTAWGALLAGMGAHDFDLAITGTLDVHPLDPWTLMRGDPDYLVDLFHSSNAAAGRNAGGFWETAFDVRGDATRMEADLTARTQSVKWAEGILAERLPAIPLYYRTQFFGYRADRFEGWQLVASTLWNYWSLQGLESNVNVPPQILLQSPTLGVVIRPGTVIDLDVRDTNILIVEYSVDGVPPSVLSAPYDLATDSWTDGIHILAVRAADPFSETREYYPFRVDGTSPTVLSVSPADGSVVPAGSLTINVTFSEPVDRPTVEAGFSILVGPARWDAADGAFTWAGNSSAFSFVADRPLPEGTVVEVQLPGNLTDGPGNPMGAAYTWEFTTPPPPATVPAVMVGGIAAVIVLAILLTLLLAMRRRRKQAPKPPQ